MRPSHRPATLLLCASLLAACGAGRYAAVASAPPAGPPATIAAAAPPAPPPAEANLAVPGPAPATPPDERPGLATTWGEATWSPITTTPFVRAAATPWATAVLHYNDRDGVAAHAAYLGQPLAPLAVDAGDGDVAVALIDDADSILPGVAAAGRNLVAAVDGARYRIAVRNHSTARFEVVASVDGRDVIDGAPAGFDRRGYVVEPGGELIIDGFRQSASEVAAFRFGKVATSYAARTAGDANVGVVGVAFFAERGAVWTRAELDRRDRADPFPGEPGRGFAVSP